MRRDLQKVEKFAGAVKIGRLQLFELDRGTLYLVAEVDKVKQKEIPKYRRPDQLAVWNTPAMPGLPPVVICSDFVLLDAWRELGERLNGEG